MRMTVKRRGLSVADVVVLIAITLLTGLVILTILPGKREASRLASCRRNLKQIGLALIAYDAMTGSLPPIGGLNGETASPHREMLVELGVPDFLEFNENTIKTRRPSLPVVREGPVRGFICPSDPNASSGIFPAPVNYRALAGSTTAGKGGPFEPGATWSLAKIEAADGVSYTAAFSERLAGDRLSVPKGRMNYSIVPGPISGAVCPAADQDAHRGDAGQSWSFSDWRSTLYNHAATPNAPRSCIDVEGKTAIMGASSGHVGATHVLRLDGTVNAVTDTVSPAIWKALATVSGQDH